MNKKEKNKMNKAELIKAISAEMGKTQKEIKEVLEATQKVVYEEMANEGEVKLFDGLTLIGQKKPACVKRNPLTGEDVNVPEKIAPKAKWGKAAKDTVNA